MPLDVTANVLTGDLSLARRQIELARESKLLEAIQIDIVDGIFADNHTFTPQDLVDIDFGDLQIDFHLMTEEPMDYVWEMEEYCRHLPIRSVFGQIEKMSYQEGFLEEVKKQDWRAGLALNIYTPLEAIDVNSWDWMDAVLLLGVEAGESGQQLNPIIFEKIKAAREKIQKGEPMRIFIDGGVNKDNVAKLQQAGVDSVTANSAFNNAPNYKQAVEEFLDSIAARLNHVE
jgi:ribulose-phosphate 3-epimerase